ncbi:TldD/PmbA family protein [Brachyspira pilosicoli]|uniref:TldD/PmbA family protein n=1 Tax=Brachyspira pilosicoli TaxID=52584 RepID=A0AAJ6GEZ8_BRAPL|nr:TldD/PmbA family protein [Brachyspira pilosicoli]MBW5392733.1 TldD/PmbA family protein [Brachyspira pilosicoli]WIH83825.1 TldD/PmbA family protein [Brachyspira pilosicoli]WIH91133.1 TldD/PmbA family protein [Brachyspira pilosicoli]WIH93424.1 TldD/PmbA family protein [Brachyspira pilosicoli]WIH95714.1 TldD/PmbA family protein [Brachyspira pilosicoli]
MKYFQFDSNFLHSVLEEALKNGGEYADLFFEDTKINNISYLDKKVDDMSLGNNYGVGLRVIVDKKTIYLYSNDTTNDSLINLARSVSSIVKNKKHIVKDFIKSKEKDNHPVHINPFDINFDEKIETLAYLDKTARKVSDKIKQVSARYMEKERNILVCTSNGILKEDSQTYIRLVMMSMASDGTNTQTSSRTKGALDGFQVIRDINLENMAIETANSAIKMLDSEYPKSGKYPVVIDNAFGGVIFHEACGHALEATSVADNASVFCNKLGEKIASDVVTAIDDGTIKNAWGSYNIDDEGNDAQRTVLIENGILKSYLVDELGSIKMNQKVTGSARRESYKYAPTSRMRNTFIDKGNSTFEELISGIEYGLYAKKMGGGSVDPATTDYNFAVSEGYLIENGKITKPVRGATLIGRGDETLMNIEAVSSNLELADGICGSISGSVPTTVGQPAIRVKELTVGGR